ncbi:MAG: PQQ-binding-like beta-propeller repeat protein [Planctomycetes bacterium]|nr:PQQ-binding-like beta-propeller repeat protein [Planctomycetota bacterium]
MPITLQRSIALVVLGMCALASCQATSKNVNRNAPDGGVHGWLHWRGPEQNGTSTETGLPEKWEVGGTNQLWDFELSGRGTPVVANDKVYALGYQGEGADLQEVLVCLDAETGDKIWEHRFNDFLSDIIYNRYSIGSPAVDAETGNVYALTSPGIFACFTGDGRPLWQHAMMEAFGRMTFPNGRTGSPLVDGDLVIVRGITSNWGAQGAPMDRFYAFDKRSGQLVWSSSPGERPKDNTFALPFLAWHNGKRVFYTGEGSGNLVCVNARTGEPLWRYRMTAGNGVNASVVLYEDKVIAIHDNENADSSEIGRMVAVRVGAEPKPGESGPVVLDRGAEAWRNALASFSSSPVLVGNRIYQVNRTGELCCVNADTGQVLWQHKLAPDQLHASPLYADGKLYVTMQNGMFFILRPSDTGVEELSKTQLAGNCLGAPAAWNGKLYVHTTERLYCFGRKGGSRRLPNAPSEPKPGRPVALQIMPAEVLMRPGKKIRFTVRGIDANGFVTGTYDSKQVKWAKFIPPTARVRSEMNAEFNDAGELVAAPGQKPSAGAFEATVEGLRGTFRGRVLPDLPLREDFEGFTLGVPHESEEGVMFAYPPLPWIGARFRWEIREQDGSKALAKTLDNVILQRATTFIGHPDMQNYTVEADVMSDGNRRMMSTAGVINQRYLIALLGNAQELEVSSNHERIKVSVPFTWAPKTWYRLKTRVDVSADGAGVVRAKAWKRDGPEPPAWTIEVPHARAHTQGSPGFYGFSPQSQFRVYVDNISVTPNE